MAVTTRRIFLGPMVSAVPYRSPLLIARLVSDLDHLSGGRFINGLGIGWNAADYGLGTNEFDPMGLSYPGTADRQAALEEAIAIIRGLWGAEPFTFHGTHYQVADAQIPPPVQRPEPPIILAGGGERVTLRQVARLADVSNFGPGPAGGVDTPADAARKLAALRRHCEEVGRPYDDILRSHFTHWVMLAETEDAVAAKVRRYFPNGLDAFWGAYLIARTPAGAIDYFQSFADVGIQHFDAQVLDPEDHETFRLLAEHVAPAVRPG
jgi:alkanesulfonate monooxygenase SsuD/methylene tetrahydromethanopterin reductase-like flavin-dependent oxidoreductase (luciferase family)